MLSCKGRQVEAQHIILAGRLPQLPDMFYTEGGVI